VEKVVKGLKNKLSTGIDKIPDYVVKQCIKLLKKPLANIYNASLESEIFSDQLKIAKVVPLYKKKDKRDIQNYRPIVLLSVFSKLLEKLVYNRLMAFIEGNVVLTEAEHGFRTKKKNQLKQQYRFLLKVCRRPLKKKKKNMTEIFFILQKLMMYQIINFYCLN
jgi:hypothetical protein